MPVWRSMDQLTGNLLDYQAGSIPAQVQAQMQGVLTDLGQHAGTADPQLRHRIVSMLRNISPSMSPEALDVYRRLAARQGTRPLALEDSMRSRSRL